MELLAMVVRRVIAFVLILSLAALFSQVVPVKAEEPPIILPPVITSIDPNQGIQGETLWVQIQGENLSGVTGIYFGPGIYVNQFGAEGSVLNAEIIIDHNAVPGNLNVSVDGPDGGAVLNNGFTVISSAPVVISIEPDHGTQGEHFWVRINGKYLSDITGIDFGEGVTVSQFSSEDLMINAQIFIAGSAVPGTRNITVTNYGGSAALTDSFTVLQVEPPSISSVGPDHGIQGENILVQIFGANLSTVTAAGFGSGITVNSLVWSGTRTVANLTIANDAVPGPRSVTVTNPAGSATLEEGFEVLSGIPAITSLIPAQGVQGEELTVRIDGDNIYTATAVSFGEGITVNGFWEEDAILYADISIEVSAVTGARNVAVTTPVDNVILAGGFTVVSGTPAIISVDPGQGSQGENLTVRINGANLSSVTGVSLGDGIDVYASWWSGAGLYASISIFGSATPGSRNVTVINPVGSGTLTNGFTVTQGVTSIDFVEPNQGIPGADILVIIGGINLSAVTAVSFGEGITVNQFQAYDLLIYASISINDDAVLGVRNVSVTSPAASASLPGGFTVVSGSPAVISISPCQGVQGTDLSVQISGANLNNVTAVNLGEGISVNITSQSDTCIFAFISIEGGALIGTRDVGVITPEGSVALINGFTVMPGEPCITSIGPDHGIQGENLTVQIHGSNLSNVSFVNMGEGITVDQFFPNDTVISASISISASAAVGTRNVFVTNPAGSATVIGAFTIFSGVPAITLIDPVQGFQGEVSIILFTGINLYTVNAVSFGEGISVKQFWPGDIEEGDRETMMCAKIAIDVNAAIGPRNITVANPAGSVTLLDGFTIGSGVPRITSIEPDHGIQGEALTVQINGEHLFNATELSFGNGITIERMWYEDSIFYAELAIEPTVALGPRNVTITSPLGSDTLIEGFRVLSGAPAITSITPVQGSQGESLNVQINGTNLSTISEVTLGEGITAGSINTISSSRIYVPISIDNNALTGTRDVIVTNFAGSTTLTGGFTVILKESQAPTITSISPNQGVQGEELNYILVTGFNLAAITEVDFGEGVTVRDFQPFDTHVDIHISIDAGAATGARSVTFTGPGGSAALADCFNVLSGAPEIDSIYPSQGVQGSDLLILIFGTHLSSVLTVNMGEGITINQVQSQNTLITASITVDGSAVLGPRDITLTNPSGSTILTGGFCVMSGGPLVTSIDINQGVQGRTLIVLIEGSNLINTTVIDFGAGITVDQFQAYDTYIIVSLSIDSSAVPGARNVTVTNLAGSAALNNVFTVLPGVPALYSIDPGQGIQGANLTIQIYGVNLSTVTVATFGSGITVNSLYLYSNNRISADISIDGSAVPGKRSVNVYNPEGSASLTDVFTVISGAPGLASIQPGSSIQGKNLFVCIQGTNLSTVTAVAFGEGITVNFFWFYDNMVWAYISIDGSAVTGARDICVTNPVGSTILTGGFAVLPGGPNITSISPDQGIQGEALTIRINGVNLSTATAVSFGGGITVNQIWQYDTTIYASVSIAGDAATGSRNVIVTNPAGITTLISGFNVKSGVPAIHAIDPDRWMQGKSVFIWIYGANLSTVTGVSFGEGITVNGFRPYDTMMYVDIALAGNAVTGARNVIVTNPAGVATLVGGFTVLSGAPVITSISPDRGRQGDELNINIRGVNFSNVSAVSFGAGITVEGFGVYSDTKIDAHISINHNAAVGSRDIILANPLGSTDLIGGFSVTTGAPAIDSIDPGRWIQGSDVNVTLNGSNLATVSAISFGAGITVTSFWSQDDCLSANISISNTAATGARDVIVNNPVGSATLAGGFTVMPGMLSSTAASLSTTSTFLGGSVITTARVTGDGPMPEGIVTFQVSTDGGSTFTRYGEDKLLFDGTATSDIYTPQETGDNFRFRAVYSGDSVYQRSQSDDQSNPLTVVGTGEPVPELPGALLLGSGLVGLMSYIIIRRKTSRSIN
jgi:hypothetical protein